MMVGGGLRRGHTGGLAVTLASAGTAGPPLVGRTRCLEEGQEKDNGDTLLPPERDPPHTQNEISSVVAGRSPAEGAVYTPLGWQCARAGLGEDIRPPLGPRPPRPPHIP